MKFAVGDKVRYTASGRMGDTLTRNNFSINGKVGVIIIKDAFKQAAYGVRFDEEFGGGHDLRGYCENGHGWWCLEESLELALERTAADLYKVWGGDVERIQSRGQG